MDNNDTLIRIRYAFDIKDRDMIKIFKFGGLVYTSEEIKKLLTKSKDGFFHEDVTDEEIDALEENIPCTNEILERFLNGFIIFKRGKQELKPGMKPQPEITIESGKSVNNVILKKIKIALGLTGDEVIDLFKKVDVTVGKSELGGLLRKEGHKHYRYCGDNYARKFLKALSMTYRK